MNLRRFILNLWRYGRSPKKALFAWRAVCNYSCIAKSEWFDKEWYLRENPMLAKLGCDPVFHYLTSPHTVFTRPSPDFIEAEYCDLHGIRDSKIIPLVHFERIGKKRGLALSYLEVEQSGGQRDKIWTHTKISLAKHQESFAGTEPHIRDKVRRGERIQTIFLVFSASMFPARPLMDAMRNDPRFDVRIAVIPDLRWPGRDPIPHQEKCEKEILKTYPDSSLLKPRPGADGHWPDLLATADIVCYPTPYDLSDFKYNPHWSVGRSFLPIQVNYFFIASQFGQTVLQLNNYNYFWKVFFEHPDILEDYTKKSLIKGANGVLVGYVKMDPLSTATPMRNPKRKCILLAPHHSVTGGYNDMMLQSNFLRYADFFLFLPSRYPDVDFIFRPHPFLFQALSQHHVWGPEKTSRYLTSLQSNSNLIWSEGGDYLSAFASSDGIIQDCGSFLVEYFYTGKPQCYMLKAPEDIENKFTKLGQSCLNHCYLAYDAGGIDDYIRNVIIKGKDVLAEQREAFRSQLMINHPNAAQAALETIRAAIIE